MTPRGIDDNRLFKKRPLRLHPFTSPDAPLIGKGREAGALERQGLPPAPSPTIMCTGTLARIALLLQVGPANEVDGLGPLGVQKLPGPLFHL